MKQPKYKIGDCVIIRERALFHLRKIISATMVADSSRSEWEYCTDGPDMNTSFMIKESLLDELNKDK